MSLILRRLRPTKPINYRDLLNGEINSSASEDQDKAYSSQSDASDCSDGAELFSKTKRAKTQQSLEEILAKIDEPDSDANEYRKQRQRNMEDRLTVLKTMDLDTDFKELAKNVPTPPRKIATPRRKPPVKPPAPAKRSSARLQKRSIDQSYQSSFTDIENSQQLNAENEDEKIEDHLNMIDVEKDNSFLEDLKNAVNVAYDSVSDFTTCDFEKFTETLKLCHMFQEPEKIIKSRIVSLDFHPSESKLLVIAGDKQGHVALRDLSSKDGLEIKAHAYNVNCVSFGKQDKTKFFSTSLDGTVREGDINCNSVNLLYSVDDEHTTWHEEWNHCLLIGEGNGCVRIFDTRTSDSNPSAYKCHKRSVRTVQMHPTNENYFLTSSGTGFFGLWDIRNMKSKEPDAIILQEFNKALTSAFYSAQGNYVVATCNDDTIRVFSINHTTSSEISRIAHNNHVGRWLSVFKAKWQPQREDCFYVGSLMNNPKRMQAYTRDGKVFHEFKSNEMTTYSPVIAVHPTKPVILGGQGSGKIHIFSPFRDLSNLQE